MNMTPTQIASSNGTSRRQVLKRLGFGAVGLTGLNLLGSSARGQSSESGSGSNEQDIAVLQFALNLEYLEAEFYSYATTGHGIEAVSGQGNKGPVIIKQNPKVPFGDPDVKQYAEEIANDERTHVLFLRKTLQKLGVTPIARPKIDLMGSFDAAAQAAGVASSFDPFANDINFLLGSFIFEDVGVTAYHGAAPLLSNPDILSGAAGLLGTEAYHAANIRAELFAQHSAATNDAVRKISDLRDTLDGGGDYDQGVLLDNKANIVPTDRDGLVFARTVRQVLNIVYFARGANKGGFFPDGINPGS